MHNNMTIMIKKTILLALLFFFNNKIFSQTTTYNNGETTLLLYTNVENTVYSYFEKLKIINNSNVYFSGILESNESVTIVPNSSNSILITPLTQPNNIPPATDDNGDPVTSISAKKASGPGRYLLLEMNPVQNSLTFHISNGYTNGLTIYDLNGYALISQNIPPTNTYTIDTSILSNGNYLLNVNLVNSGYSTIQFIKN